MNEKVNNKKCMKEINLAIPNLEAHLTSTNENDFNQQITVFKDDGELIARIFKENGEVKGLVKDGYLVDIKRLANYRK